MSDLEKLTLELVEKHPQMAARLLAALIERLGWPYHSESIAVNAIAESPCLAKTRSGLERWITTSSVRS